MSKTIIICCDGSWKGFNTTYQTNIKKTWELLAGSKYVQWYNKYGTKQNLFIEETDATVNQLCYYDNGVGSLCEARTLLGHVNNYLRYIFGGLFGAGFSRNRNQAYKFIRKHYEKGDRIYLLGFSRGAATVRSLSHVLGYHGLMYNFIPFYKTFIKIPFITRTVEKVIDVPAIFAYDTVSALGFPVRDKFKPSSSLFYNFSLCANVHNGYQALAKDEDRVIFEPLLWEESDIKPYQKIEQVWFKGTHLDIGGGRPEDDSGLSNITLNWMLNNMVIEGVKFKTFKHFEENLDVTPLTSFKLFKRKPRNIPTGAVIHN